MRRAFLAPFRVVLLCAGLLGGLTAWPGLGTAQAASPPEFWIAPDKYAIAPDEPLVANLRSGRMFVGETLGFAAAGLHRFEVMTGAGHKPIDGASGDVPAVHLTAPEEGLALIVHESIGPVQIWTRWSDFVDFAMERNFPWALDDHRDRGLPRTGFKQGSLRFAKALVAVGDGAGQDRAVGLETEIVALANPYADDLSSGLRLQVLYQGKPRKNARVTVHCRNAEGVVDRRVIWTDMDGKVNVGVQPGAEYLIDAVMLRPLAGNAKDSLPVWEALWTSLTFRTPNAR